MRTCPFYGTGTALVTPFTAAGNIDFPALERLVHFQLDGDVEFLVVCGSTGESATMTEEEDRSVIRFVVECVQRAKKTVNGQPVRVVAGTGSNNTREAARYTKCAQELGADGALVVTPYYNKPPAEGLLAHYKAICDAAPDFPLILYNVPSRTGSNVSAETQLAIAEACPSVVATKEASGNLDQMMEIIAHAPEGFAVLSGDDSLTLPLIAAGGKGVISVLSNYAPRGLSELVRAALAGDFVRARALQYTYLELMKLNFVAPNPIPVKAILAMMGLIDEHLRLPLVPLNASHRETLRTALTRAGLLP
ncbi:MAG: 4-hydroxy-tetrahydrodipicolinate synthase [Bacteroidota bacterium]|nr:4-hydroxy-tetrahydrodipicolinate synthase [Candidatus Kapabacteria bacterium]MDW8220181.1 4-hydroxy-tetrahydrodipicolinate synthase [Bacteroidota bacterium]